RATHPMMRLPTLPLVGYGLARPSRLNTALTLRIVMRDKANITQDLQHLTNTYSAQAGSHLAFYRALRSGVGLFGVIGRDSFARIARQMACPTLVVWGRHDRVFPSAQSEAALEMLPDGTRVLIDQCGHYPHWEQPDAFCDAVETHLAPSLPAEVSA
ncbi:MAG: alpha/beta fold hydrolase, partial [Pseudomonadota bacterium]